MWQVGIHGKVLLYPKPGCMHINLGFPSDAAVNFLSHSLHFRTPFHLPCSVDLCPAPTRQEGCACHKTSYDLWRCFRKTPGGCWLSRPRALCLFTLEATLGAGLPYLRHRVSIQRRDTFLLLLILVFLHPASSGYIVLRAGVL